MVASHENATGAAIIPSDRIQTYSKISTALACLSDQELSARLESALELHSGIGGKLALLTINGVRVFVKKIPLTDLEQRPQNIRSTANIFHLPLYYQYGVGSTGFGAWRELAAHIMTTNWVIAGDCPCFPLMYHWRIMPAPKPNPLSPDEQEALDKRVKYWESSKEIRNRLARLHDAKAYMVLFVEYIPQTLNQWLKEKFQRGGAVADSAVKFVDDNLGAVVTFLKKQGFVHFDAHFHNILTDGNLVYLSDFGLALSPQFDLTDAEKEFLRQHNDYDRRFVAMNLLKNIMRGLFGKEISWNSLLKNYLEHEIGPASPTIDVIIQKYAKDALSMGEFCNNLMNESKNAVYPF